MQIGIISLFPKMFDAITNFGVVGRAVRNKLISIQYWNPRDFTTCSHRRVDDRPYGGGPGMVMMVDPLKKTLDVVRDKMGTPILIVYLSPQGKIINYRSISKLSSYLKIVLVCGRYKGIDERFISTEIDMELSIGDYILSGGELAAMVLIDAISRLLPEILNNQESIVTDSFINGILDYPNYTRPYNVNGLLVPSILLSGNHKKIYRWRLKQALGYTWLKRPELLNCITLNDEQIKLLLEFKHEFKLRKY